MAQTTPLAGAPLRHAGRSGSTFSHLTQVYAIWRERQALARLSPALLADVGLSEKDARKEAARPIWDIPAGRTHQ